MLFRVSPQDGPLFCRPRVLHVLGGAEMGGMERQLLALLPHLSTGSDARLLLVRGGALEADFAATVSTRVVEKVGKFDPVCLARMVSVVRRQNPDIVHSWGSTANLWGPLAARLGGARHTVMSDVSIDAWKGRAQRAFDARLYPRADVVTGNSPAVVEASISRGARPDHVAVVANGVDLPATVAEPGERDPATVLFLGRMHPDKGPDLLIDAIAHVAAKLPELNVLVAGPATQPVERELAAAVAASVERLGLSDRVELLGPVSQPASLLRRASMLVMSSRTEGAPNVIFEAFAHGTPVVAFAVGGVPELLDGGRLGRLVPGGDAAALGDAMFEVLGDPAAAHRRAALGRSYVEDGYSLTAVADQWLRLYADVLSVDEITTGAES